MSESNKRKATEELVRESAKKINIREPSIFGIKPVDDVTKYIADFIAQHVSHQHVEIEAKLGVFMDKKTNQRMDIGAYTETVMEGDLLKYYRFEANMSMEQHAHFNRILNNTVNKSQAPDYRGERVKYKHTVETDHFYEIPHSRNKYRVTIDQKTNEIVPNGIIEKTRIADLNIHSPNQPLDYRISINVEQPRTKPSGEPVYERNKDRVSYQHAGIAFDLTQVKGSKDREPDTRHELELEIIDSSLLAAEKQKHDRKEPSLYTSMIEILVNNIRILSRSALTKK